MSPSSPPAPSPASTPKDYALVASAAALWGCWSLFFRSAERAGAVHPALEALFVFGVIVLVVLPGSLREPAPRPRTRLAWLGLLWLGLGDAFNNLLFFASMQRSPLAVSVLTHYLAPVLVAATAPFVLREPAKRSTWAALALALLGLGLLLEPWRAHTATGPRGDVPLGALLGAGSAVFYASNVLVIKRVGDHFTPRQLLAWHLIPSMAVVALFVPRGGFTLAPLSALWLAVGSLGPGALAGLLFLRGIARIPASHGAVLTLLEPTVAVLVGALVWKELPGPFAALGGVLVLAGAALVVRGPGAERR